MNAREEELTARTLLENQELIDIYLHQRRWPELAALVRYVRRDVPPALAATDPALYRRLREQITRFHLRGGGCFSLPQIEALASPSGTMPGDKLRLFERLDARMDERDVALAKGEPDPGYPLELEEDGLRDEFRQWQQARLAAQDARDFGGVDAAEL